MPELSDDILPIPHLPPGLREAAQRGTLIPFVGAGISRLAGCPGWSELANGALRQMVEQGKITHGHLAQINHLSPRIKLSIARILQREHSVKIDFRQLLQPSGWNDDPKGRKLYGSLVKLSRRFVTTNYDEWLDEELSKPTGRTEIDAVPDMTTTELVQTFWKVRDLTPASLSYPNSVIHLHGSLSEPDKMVLTTQDYVAHYANDRQHAEDPDGENRVLTFLEYLFKERTVLFVGYGLEELEVLEYVMLKAQQRRAENEQVAKHYLLQGFFSHEKELMLNMKRYYLESGIELIPFQRDQKDWDQLLDVLEEFARVAPASDPMFLQEFKEMEDLLNG